jgi:hypothetical protein
MFRIVLQAQFNRESVAGGIGINPRMERGATGKEEGNGEEWVWLRRGVHANVARSRQ